ncbi:hypothetical protein NDU88_007361 [Pleurodeles waltl]|uniref:Uncharacterized protein n=1 Tax=Pleurodeles waltl TaxID=8319 RepID=A0AAV7PTU1_PLEWA|nr:hypothetical protein NDU88_007361 [Pleurodeles waltl]
MLTNGRPRARRRRALPRYGPGVPPVGGAAGQPQTAGPVSPGASRHVFDMEISAAGKDVLVKCLMRNGSFWETKRSARK